MLIISPKPAEISGHHPLAVNLESYDEILASKSNKTNLFYLSLIKEFDGHRSSHSSHYYILGTFQSAEDCLAVFQNIVDALNSDQKTFELPESQLPVEPKPADPKDRGTGFL